MPNWNCRLLTDTGSSNLRRDTLVSNNRIDASRRGWEEFRWTNAILATTNERDPNPADGCLAGLAFTVKDTFATGRSGLDRRIAAPEKPCAR